jgi:uncharacterized protein (DUF433 family)
MPAVAYPHIEFRSDGVPIITGTRTKVEEIVLDHLAYHWDAEQIYIQYPYLTLGQIHSALAYYYDHKVEMDRAIEAGARRVEEIRASLGESPVRAKLKAQGLIQ